MDAIISSIIKELKLNDDEITNIFNYGSWVYGTNHEKSDRDFLIVIDIKDARQRKPLRFDYDFDYFHRFQLHRIKNYDVTIHSCQNFEILLKKNYMLAVECLFYPDEFILRNKIDYKTIYLSKYYNPLRIKQVTFYENNDSFKYIITNEQNGYRPKSRTNPTVNEFLCDAMHMTTIDEDRLLKYLFHGVRYLDIGEQLLEKKSIDDFKRASYVLSEMKDIYIKNDRNMDFVIDYAKMKGDEYKMKLHKLVPTNIIDGEFKIHITIDSCRTEKLVNVCNINKFKVICFHQCHNSNSKQLITSAYCSGRYPDLIEQMNSLINEEFKDFVIIRLKIKSLLENTGIPENDIDKLLFWNENSTYFEFRYKIWIESKMKFDQLKALCKIVDLFVAFNEFERQTIDEGYCIIVMRLFRVGRRNALIKNKNTIAYLTTHNFPPIKVTSDFVVYDSNIDFDCVWTDTALSSPTINITVINSGPKYRIGFKNRKVFSRSGESLIPF